LFSLSAIDVLISNLDLKLSYCPSGYNKDNYLFNLNFEKNKNLFNSFNFHFLAKKPDFFSYHYYNGFSFDWNSFLKIKQIGLTFNSSVPDRYFSSSFFINRMVNFVYFNDLATPVQILDPILYLKWKLNKSWNFGYFSLNSSVCLQYSDNDIAISLPFVLYNQDISYNRSFINDLNISGSLRVSFFSKYYPNSFFPLTDIFYTQREDKSRILPFFSAQIQISKKQFSFGFISDHLSSFIIDDNFLTPSYFLPSPNIRLFIKWSFLN